MVVGSMKIGSRPPRCEEICRACGRCEAVQVPAMRQRRENASFSDLMYRKRDDGSNYKPLSWKCKCGDLILNP
ncbi:EPIDERMAL PATTERNING FACTOR-like protein 2 [Platanthera guangdongensis]|uniref:Epidermal patterning factor-like protein n=1 Tax=Platanthera guangdongensis TaxID=2320717 RepID=A0ABR2LME9_9ASPA